jgi:ketosteroid isomerase-like protein
MTSDLLRAALAAIDDANSTDPTIVTVGDRHGPKEIVHAELVSAWVARLDPDPSDALAIAARGHHLRRWTSPRTSHPPGRSGYLRWRTALYEQHARDLGEILTTVGYDDPTIARVQSLVRKDAIRRPAPAPDADASTLEDALCLVFFETQLADVVVRLDPPTLARVLVKTLRKMSDRGRARLAELALEPGAQHALDEARGREVVDRYLTGLAGHDWGAVAATLAPDVERIGPYGDVVRGGPEYAEFLRATITSLAGYELQVVRVVADGPTVAVELNETVDDDGARLHTDETVVFDTADGLIGRVAVYLQTSQRRPNPT